MANTSGPRPTPSELDPLIHERLRLGIVSALAVQASLSFTELRELLQTTDGNLSVHAKKLEEAGYVTCTKNYEERKPRSVYALTASGRRALAAYLDTLSEMLPRRSEVQGERDARCELRALPSQG